MCACFCECLRCVCACVRVCVCVCACVNPLPLMPLRVASTGSAHGVPGVLGVVGTHLQQHTAYDMHCTAYDMQHVALGIDRRQPSESLSLAQGDFESTSARFRVHTQRSTYP